MTTIRYGAQGAAAPPRKQTLWAQGIDDAKRAMIRLAVHEADGSVAAAARSLGLSPQLLHRYITVLDLRVELTLRGRGGARPGCNRTVPA